MTAFRNEVIERVLREEDLVQQVASRLAEVAEHGDPAALDATRHELGRMLDHELEAHLALEEVELFPPLAERGLALEVGAALEQHADLRRLRAALRDVSSGDAYRAWLRRFVHDLEQHVRFEADFLYVDLRAREAEEFGRDEDAALRAAQAER